MMNKGQFGGRGYSEVCESLNIKFNSFVTPPKQKLKAFMVKIAS